MFSMTLQVSPGIGTMAYGYINAILLLTSLFSCVINAAPTINSNHHDQSGNGETRSTITTTSHHTQFWDIMHHSEDLYTLHHPIYNQYRLQRMRASDLVLTTIRIEGFPNFRSISDRADLGINDLTISDREFLNMLLTAMRYVHEDEGLYPGLQDRPTGFLEDFEEIVTQLEGLLAKVDEWIELNEISGTNHLTSEEEFLWPDVQQFERSIHAVYILQEMNYFIPHFRRDFMRLFYSHHSSPSDDDGHLQR